MKLRRLCTLFAATALAAFGTTGAPRAAELVIAVPIAQAGIYAFVGNPGLRSIKLAVDAANASGELGGNTIKLVIGDDNSQQAQAITLANRMVIGDQALAIVGAAGTTPALAVAGIANDKHVPFIALATSPAVTAAGKYSFHVMAGPNLQVDRVVNYALDHLHPKTGTTIWTRDNEGAVVQGKRARELMAGKVQLLPEETVLNSDTDFSAVLTKLTAEQPDLFFVTMSEFNSANLILQARQMGLKSHVVGTTTMVGPGFLKTGGPAVEGILAPTDYSVDRSDKLNTDFVAAYTKAYGEKPDNWAALGYTAIQVVINAIKAAGPNPTRDAVRDAMEKTHDMPSVLGTGKYSFDASREPSYDMAILTVKDGKFALAPQ